MDSVSMGDEVRFRANPDIIDNHQTTKSHSWTRYTDNHSGHGGPNNNHSGPNNNHNGPNNNRNGPTNNHKSATTNHSSATTNLQKIRGLARPQPVVNKDGFIELDLSSKNLRRIPDNIYNLLRLEVLKVNHNQLSSVGGDISKLHKLRKLLLQQNQITSIHETVANCVHLQYLDLSDNQVSQVPRSLGMLRNLKVLNFTNNNLEVLPHELGDLASIRQLELAGNRLWHIPASLQRLKHLRCLNLSRNNLDQLPLCVCHMKHLEALDLHGNHLNTLPPDVSSLRFLRELSLAANRFQNLPHSLLALHQLQSLDLSNNQLKSLPAKISQLHKLQMLILHGNQLVDIPAVLSNLRYLNVAHNKLENVSVVSAGQLRYLNISHNALENMPHGVYNLPQLQVLKLADNHIAYISQDVILLKKLRVLDLANNQLTSLPQVIDELEHLEVFNIQGNKIETRSQLMFAPKLGSMPGGNPQYSSSTSQNHGRRRPSRGLPVYRKKSVQKKTRESRFKVPWNKKNGYTKKLHQKPTSQHIATQYTPKSTVRSQRQNRDPSLTSIFGSSRHKANGTIPRSSMNGSPAKYSNVNTLAPSDMGGVSGQNPGILTSNPRSISEIVYPMASTRPPASISQHHTEHTDPGDPEASPARHQDVGSYTEDWLEGRAHTAAETSSNAVTINEPIGDDLSLGEEDFQFVPVNIPDRKLMRLCNEAESWLNNQLLKPLQINRGIFRKSVNEGGTLRTLNGITHHNSLHGSQYSDAGLHVDTDTIQMTKDIYLKRPPGVPDNGILRLKMDVFRVTPSGGLFKSTSDPNISVFFPANAVSHNVAVSMQIERISVEAVESAKKMYSSLHNLLAVGDIVHIKQSRDVDFKEQVSISIPAPPLLHRGKLHLVTYREDNTCCPCASKYRLHQGYITLQAWHFSGRGAVLSKSKDKYKACKAMEGLLKHLYV